MRKNKKGIELSVNVIIIAVIALLVLVVLFAAFTGRFIIFINGIKDCAAKGGTCKDKGSCLSGQEIAQPGTNCAKTEDCCIPLTNK